jgi:hypothetical protein
MPLQSVGRVWMLLYCKRGMTSRVHGWIETRTDRQKDRTLHVAIAIRRWYHIYMSQLEITILCVCGAYIYIYVWFNFASLSLSLYFPPITPICFIFFFKYTFHKRHMEGSGSIRSMAANSTLTMSEIESTSHDALAPLIKDPVGLHVSYVSCIYHMYIIWLDREYSYIYIYIYMWCFKRGTRETRETIWFDVMLLVTSQEIMFAVHCTCV